MSGLSSAIYRRTALRTEMSDYVHAGVPPVSWWQRQRADREVDRTFKLIAEAGRLTLSKFIEQAWHAVEPVRPYKSGWAIDAIAEHCQAVADGQILRLAIACPPGLMKSLTTCVFLPAWLWGPMGRPSTRVIGFSHDTDLSVRDAMRCRWLMQSNWYQTLWGDRFRFLDDQNQKTRYVNDQTGFRISDYVGGGTGDRGDILIVDDPHQVKDPESDAMRQRALLWLHETMPTRLVDPASSAIVVIHHRLHAQDVIGEILSSEMGFELLCLPMEFERKRRCSTSIGWRDPRQHEGELLFPERFPPEVVERDKKALGSYAYQGQFQQNPIPRGGNMFKRHWFEIVNAAPADCYWVRRWDLAASEEREAAFTAGVLMGRSRSSKTFYIKDVKRGQLNGDAVKRLISQTAAIDLMEVGKKNYSVWLPQDPGQAGLVQAKDFTNLLAGYNVKVERETGEKMTRAEPLAAQCEAGNVKLVRGSWNAAYLDEICAFPASKHADQVDASSGAFGSLILFPKQQMIEEGIAGLY